MMVLHKVAGFVLLAWRLGTILVQRCGIRNGRMFCIIKGRIKHVFYDKKRGKKRNEMKCLQYSTEY